MPWMRPPSWLYPPPRSHGEADDDTRACDAKRRRQRPEGLDDAEGVGAEATSVMALATESVAPTPASDLAATAEDRPPAHESTSAPVADVAAVVGQPTPTAAARSARRDGNGIRGRGSTPGTGSPPPAQAAGIRGPAHGPGAQQRDVGIGAAQRKLAARNWHLRISLEQHAERVSRKREHAQDESSGPTAAERLAAIRRRIACRAEGQQGAAETREVARAEHPAARDDEPLPRQAAAHTEGSASPETGATGGGSHVRPSIEDVKIQLHLHGGRIHATACQARTTAGNTDDALETGPRGGGGDQRPATAAATPPPASVAAAARHVAWHSSSSAATNPPREGG